MISRDQAEQVADTILEPSRQVLEARQEKTAKLAHRRQSPFFPAIFAAWAALLMFDYSDNLTTSVMVGTVVGWAIGKYLRRPI